MLALGTPPQIPDSVRDFIGSGIVSVACGVLAGGAALVFRLLRRGGGPQFSNAIPVLMTFGGALGLPIAVQMALYRGFEHPPILDPTLIMIGGALAIGLAIYGIAEGFK